VKSIYDKNGAGSKDAFIELARIQTKIEPIIREMLQSGWSENDAACLFTRATEIFFSDSQPEDEKNEDRL